MATTLKDLLAQQEKLEAQIAELRAAERTEAISKVRALVETHGLTQNDIFGRAKTAWKQKTEPVKVAAKYRDPVSGKEWSGRGLPPKWLTGKKKEDFLIA